VRSMHEHADDALSALLDGALNLAEEAEVRAHVAECEACAAELEAVRAARSWVRTLPLVDPPFGFFERLLATRRRRRFGAAAMVAATAASLAFVATLPAREEPVKPAVASLVRTHAITASVDGDPLSGLATAGVPVSFQP
jgi:anti-sigma factor RsiW